MRAFRFELTKVQVPRVRERVVAQLRNVAEELARAVADGLGMTELPDALAERAEARTAARESLVEALVAVGASRGQEGIKTRRIAMLVADGVDGDAAAKTSRGTVGQGAVPRFVGVKLGQVQSESGEPLEVEISLEAAPSVLWDAAVFLEGEALSASGHALEFLKDQYRHCKPILLLDGADVLLEKAGIPPALASGDADPGLMRFENSDVGGAVAAFVAALTSTDNSTAKRIPHGCECAHSFAKECNHGIASTQGNLLQSLTHERGGVLVYRTALECALNSQLRDEWESYPAPRRTGGRQDRDRGSPDKTASPRGRDWRGRGLVEAMVSRSKSEIGRTASRLSLPPSQAFSPRARPSTPPSALSLITSSTSSSGGLGTLIGGSGSSPDSPGSSESPISLSASSQYCISKPC